MHWCMWTQLICTVTYKCLEEGEKQKEGRENTIWWGKEQDKEKEQRGQAGENWRKRKEKETYVWRRQRREEGKERQDRECIAYNSRALKAA